MEHTSPDMVFDDNINNVFTSHSPFGHYNPLVDYLGLSDFMSTSKNVNGCDNRFRINVCEGLSPFYHLERIRSDAFDDFQHNGVDRELDELDIYQAQLRGQNVTDRVLLSPDKLNADSNNNNQDADGNAVSGEFQFDMGCSNKEEEYMSFKKRKEKAKKKNQVCVFCKNNNERRDMYENHVLKDDNGNITCPILFKYVCPICGKSGSDAHTITYCPMNNGDCPRTSLLRTSRLATGKKRKMLTCPPIPQPSKALVFKF